MADARVLLFIARNKEPMTTLLQVRDLRVRYRPEHAAEHLAVDGVSFDVDAAEVVGLMGESGCGKTTIAMSLLKLLDEKSAAVTGSVQFRGKELLQLDEQALEKIRGAKISFVSQEPGISLSPVLRVGEQIAEVRRAHSNSTWRECRAEAERWLAQVGLQPVKRIFSSYPHQLSGGQLQRVTLAQSLIGRPEMVIADEPTASLDAVTQAEFLALMREMKSQLGISMLLISHSPQVQAALADRLLVMKEGRIVVQGRGEEIWRGAAGGYAGEMLGIRSAAREVEIDAKEAVTR